MNRVICRCGTIFISALTTLAGMIDAVAAADAAKSPPRTTPVIERHGGDSRNAFFLEDGATLGEDRAAVSFAGGWPRSRLMFQIAPKTYFDMGIDLEVGYDPDIDLAYFLETQMLEAPSGWFNLALRVSAGFLWEHHGARNDFYITPSFGVVMGFRVEPVSFPLELITSWDVALPKRLNHRGSFDAMGGVEWRFLEQWSVFAKGGYRAALLNHPYQGGLGLLGFNLKL